MIQEIYFFSNGIATIIAGNVQVDSCSWAEVYASYLENKGLKPEDYVLHFPSGGLARFVKTTVGWNWRFE